jgi:cysteine synthase A
LAHPGTHSSILDLIGRTPVVELRRLRRAGEGTVFAKLEVFNPGGSVKDRIAVSMLEAAERDGRLGPGGTVVEPTAGNTGVGLALVGRLRGYRVILVMPEGFAKEKELLARTLGAEVVRTPAADRMPGAIQKAQELASSIPGAFCPQQFANPSNPDIHYLTTGAELWEQMDGRVDALCLGAGTGGTLTGVARRFKERNPAVHVVLVEPQGSVFGGGEAGDHKVEGIGNSFIPETTDMGLVDEVMMVDDATAFETLRRLARTEGILAGSSGAAAVFAAWQVAARLGEAARVATVIPDSIERYLSSWEEELAT